MLLVHNYRDKYSIYNFNVCVVKGCWGVKIVKPCNMLSGCAGWLTPYWNAKIALPPRPGSFYLRFEFLQSDQQLNLLVPSVQGAGDCNRLRYVDFWFWFIQFHNFVHSSITVVCAVSRFSFYLFVHCLSLSYLIADNRHLLNISPSSRCEPFRTTAYVVLSYTRTISTIIMMLCFRLFNNHPVPSDSSFSRLKSSFECWMFCMAVTTWLSRLTSAPVVIYSKRYPSSVLVVTPHIPA